MILNREISVPSFFSSDTSRDVLITGVGVVSPLGSSAVSTWQRLIAGERAARQLDSNDIDHFDQLKEISGLRLHGAPVDHWNVAGQLSQSPFYHAANAEIRAAWISEPLVAMSLVALQEAANQAAISFPVAARDRLAVVFGSSKGGLRTAEKLTAWLKSGIQATKSSSPIKQDRAGMNLHGASAATSFESLWSHAFQTNSATQAIAATVGANAAVSCPVAACATGLISVIQGAAMIRSGLCDVCIVGSADAGLRASVVSSFHRLRVTSRCNAPPDACRPFDSTRDGFVIGEGAGVMILESRSHAEARGVSGLARVHSGTWLSDPTGMTQIDATGAVVAEVLKRAGVSDQFHPDVIGVHGTGTESNDLAEARGIFHVFGESSPQCFGVKGAIGHLLGAAGSVETILTVLSLLNQQIPATANLQNQDPRCRIPLCAKSQFRPAMRRAAKLSLGFGGHVACGLFEAES